LDEQREERASKPFIISDIDAASNSDGGSYLELRPSIGEQALEAQSKTSVAG
jgi:hypothetical protein